MLALGVGLAVAGVAGGRGAAVASESPSPQAPVVDPAVQVNTDDGPTRAHNQPHVLIDPTNPRVVVIVDADYTSRRCEVHVSYDAGVTWVSRPDGPQPPQYASCVRPAGGSYLASAFGPTGTLYVLAPGGPTGGGVPGDAYLARSSNRGQTWSYTTVAHGDEPRPFVQADGTTLTAPAFFTAMRLAADPHDASRVYVGFTALPAQSGFFGGRRPALFARSVDGGRTFSAPVDAFASLPLNPDDHITYQDPPALAIGTGGALYAFATVTIARGSAPPAGEVVMMATSRDYGKTWNARVIDDSILECPFCTTDPVPGIDPSTGALYLVFSHVDSAPPAGQFAVADFGVWFERSTDGGRTWSKRVRLDDDRSTVTPGYNHYFPGLSVAPNGRIDVAWHDFRTDAAFNPAGNGASEIYWDVYSTYSVDGGRTWHTNVRVSDRSMNANEGYTNNAQYGLTGSMGIASDNGSQYVVWSDSRRGHPDLPVEDMYLATVRVGPGSGDRTSTSRGAVFFLGVATGVTAAAVALLVGVLALARRRSVEGAGVVPSTPGVARPGVAVPVTSPPRDRT